MPAPHQEPATGKIPVRASLHRTINKQNINNDGNDNIYYIYIYTYIQTHRKKKEQHKTHGNGSEQIGGSRFRVPHRDEDYTTRPHGKLAGANALHHGTQNGCKKFVVAASQAPRHKSGS